MLGTAAMKIEALRWEDLERRGQLAFFPGLDPSSAYGVEGASVVLTMKDPIEKDTVFFGSRMCGDNPHIFYLHGNTTKQFKGLPDKSIPTGLWFLQKINFQSEEVMEVEDKVVVEVTFLQHGALYQMNWFGNPPW